MSTYIGRFAPSPTGPLHVGSLLTAVASWCDARAAHGQWLLRIEDIDTTRCHAEAAEHIIRTLEHYGLWWDDQIVYQSQRHHYYQDALAVLQQQGDIFWCVCSRRELAETHSPIYTGHCRNHPHYRANAAARVLIPPNTSVTFHDAVFGEIRENIAQEVGDFVIYRRDGLFAYQLAVVVDDAEQGITHVVRGADLLDNTARQIYLQQRLLLPSPHYAHIPLVVNHIGEKLSKQTGATALTWDNANVQLWQALTQLGQCPPDTLQFEHCEQILNWAILHWQRDNIPKQFIL
ncbi:tRNA glutamyl-Q(34) synthetase GluQRS [Moraxellaceae bacterium AER2_44_116]|nr:tRNA glutamyl-Q(34) synthetase GluQRS [Moraxellaceae bacterium]TQC95835.1 tRNA glutamyl-Q(34) synthetase GluQRS [Moraxellaceae bacterium AER2_44_116]